MPFLFLIIGLVMVISAVRNTQGQLIQLAEGDFTGKNNFIFWLAAIGVLGGLGYIGPLKTISRYFMALVIIVLFLKNGGVFQEFVSALDGVNSKQATAKSPTATINTGTSSGNSSTPPITDYLQSSDATTTLDDPFTVDGSSSTSNLQTQEPELTEEIE